MSAVQWEGENQHKKADDVGTRNNKKMMTLAMAFYIILEKLFYFETYVLFKKKLHKKWIALNCKKRYQYKPTRRYFEAYGLSSGQLLPKLTRNRNSCTVGVSVVCFNKLIEMDRE